MNKKSLLLLVAFVLLIAPAGCIFSPDDGDDDQIKPGPESQLPFAGSEDLLMTNFRTVYEDMDFNSYRDMLHPDYKMILQPSTTTLYPDVGTSLDLEEDLRITERMFSGEPLTDPNGELVPGISSISFDQLEQQGTWATSPSNDVIPNARFGLFEVIFRFERPGHSTLMVQGQIKFYVAGRDSFHEGADRTYWQIIGQQDLTQDSDQ